jgi:hypothetical protein
MDWLAVGLARRELQDMEGALEALGQALAMAPTHPMAAFAYAQVLFETGRDSLAAFAQALALDPHNPHLIRTYAAALAAEGQSEQAQSILLETLAQHPQWLDGHKSLATLRVATGRRQEFDESFRLAIKALPNNLSLRLAHIHLLSTARDWEAAETAILDAIARLGTSRGLEMARLSLISERGGPDSLDPHLFDAVADWQDPGLDLCRVRHSLRRGEIEAALARALPHQASVHARLFWPYVSLCWRLLGDEKARWLDGEGSEFIQTVDLGLTDEQLADLVQHLRALHTAQAPYIEQSVKGGTQTDRQLFFRPIPVLQEVRQRILAAVEAYVAALPHADPNHPLLGPRRDRPLLFEGSWSVLLKGGGFHSVHTHPMGWISSALHIEVPEPAQAGPDRAGHLAFGEAPPELGIALAPIRTIAPKAGTLVLFPSTQWHGTRPIAAGERLSLAFDIRPPAR